MINAKEAYNETCEQLKKISKTNLEKIEEGIEKEILKGGFDYYCSEKIEKEIIQELKSKGYKIKFSYAEIDDYGNYYPGCIVISWRNKNKIGFLKRIIRAQI